MGSLCAGCESQPRELKAAQGQVPLMIRRDFPWLWWRRAGLFWTLLAVPGRTGLEFFCPDGGWAGHNGKSRSVFQQFRRWWIGVALLRILPN